MTEEFDCDYTDEVVCPYCGYTYTDSWEFDAGGSRELDCEECGETFMLWINFSVSYTTGKKEKPNA